MRKGVAHSRVLGLVGNDHGIGLELDGLLYQQVGVASGTQHLDGKQVAVAAYDIESLCAYRAGGTEYCYSFHQNEIYSSGFTAVPPTHSSKCR